MALSRINANSITDDSITVDQIADTAVHGRRNIIINGAMQVAQRGATATTSAGFQNVDRFQSNSSQATITRSQETLSSGDPYDDGFRKFYRMQVTAASSNTNAYAEFHQPIEGQNINQSAWQYKSTNSSITLSFWARSSLAGTYYIMFRTLGSGDRRRNGAFTLAADTWTKVTFTTAGNSGLTIDNDNTRQFDVFIVPHYGTDFTGGEEVSTTDWYDRSGQTDAYLPNFAQNWTNTLNATFDLTGVQLEVGDKATPFEHRSFGEELALCQRYYQRTEAATSGYGNLCVVTNISASSGTDQRGVIPFTTNMRTNPSLSTSGSLALLNIGGGLSSIAAGDGLATHSAGIRVNSNSNMSSGQSGLLRQNNDTTAHLQFDAEL